MLKILLRLAIAGGSTLIILATLLHLFTQDGGADGINDQNRPGVFNAIIDTDYTWVALYAPIFLLSILIRAVRYRYLLRICGETNMPTFGQMALVTGIRNMTVDLLPARLGELSYVGMLNQAFGVKLANCISSLALAIAFDFAALLFVIIGIIFAHIMGSGAQEWTLGVLLMAILVSAIAFIGLFIIVPWFDNKLKQGWFSGLQKYRWLNPLFELFDKFSESLMTARQSGSTLTLLGLSIIIRLLKYSGFYLLFMAVAIPSFQTIAELPPAHILSALIGGEVGASMPVPSIMSFGAYEAGGVLTLHLLGVADTGGGLITLLVTHILSQMYDYIIGATLLVLFILLYKKKRQKPAEKPGKLLWITAIILSLSGVGYIYAEAKKAMKLGSVTAPKDIGSSSREQEKDGLTQSQSELADLNGFLVFASNRNGNHDIYRMSLPDLSITQITDHPNTEFYARISPDGKRVLFSRSQQTYVSWRNPAAWDVYLLDLETDKESLIAQTAHYPGWVDNDTITYTKDGTHYIKQDLNTGNTETLFTPGEGNRMPKGAKIFTSDYNAKTGQVTIATRQDLIGGNITGTWGTAITGPDNAFNSLYNGCQSFWSPDGELLFQVIPEGRQGNQFVSFDEDYQPTLLLDLVGEFSHEYFPKVSNDNSHMIFAASRSRKEHDHDAADYEIFIWEIGSDPEKATRVTFHSGNDNWPDLYLEK